MTEQDFFTSLDRYGADMTQWPNAAAAEGFMQAHPSAAAALADLRSLEMFMAQDSAPNDAQSGRVLRKVNAQLDAEAANTGSAQLLNWSQVAAAMVPLVMSFAIGLSLGSANSPQLDALPGDVENDLYLADHWLFESAGEQGDSEEATR